MAIVRPDLRKTRRGELGGYGVQHSDPLLYAAIRDSEHSLFQMADEQGPRFHDVPSLLCLRRRLVDVRVRDPRLSGLGTIAIASNNNKKNNDNDEMSNEQEEVQRRKGIYIRAFYGSRHRVIIIVARRRQSLFQPTRDATKRKRKNRNEIIFLERRIEEEQTTTTTAFPRLTIENC